MDQIQIGKFIAECRKENKLTQAQLAEKLGVSDRAVSKWETGRCMPDSSLMPELCELIGISINDLFNGRRVTMENYNKAAEAAMLQMKKNEEQKNRMLLKMEWVIGGSALFTLAFALCIASLTEGLSDTAKGVIIILGFVQFLICMFFGLKIETDAGYYKCDECGHTYVPKYKDVFLAMHIGRTRKMTCPCCGKKSWQKKIVIK